MCLLLETIQLLDGNLQNVEYHNRRLNASIKECFGVDVNNDISELIQIPPEYKTGLHRCRLIYDYKSFHIEFTSYTFRNIKSLRLVYDDQIDYHLKFADRSRLDFLFSQREDCDDIIIVKNGCLTDSFAANLVFGDGIRWFTPDTPLLAGTMRAQLLDNDFLTETRITISNFREYKYVGLINAFLTIGNMPVILVESIVNT
jgi:4-amino-4-deoxychorismate lyase